MSKIRHYLEKAIAFLLAIPFSLEILIKLGAIKGIDYSQMQSCVIAYNTLSFLFSIANFILLYAWLFYLVMDMFYFITSIYFPFVIEELLENQFFNLKPFISKRAKETLTSHENISFIDALKVYFSESFFFFAILLLLFYIMASGFLVDGLLQSYLLFNQFVVFY